MIVNIARVWEDIAVRHKLFMLWKLQGLTDALKGFVGPAMTQHRLVEFLDKHREAICGCDPLALPGVIVAFSQTFARVVDIDYLNGFFKKYLCYKEFSAKERVVLLKRWDAYALCTSIRSKICPYCHITPIDTYVSPDGLKAYRPNIDHYYPQAEFPLLALTMGNFIPCCEKCNGPQMKGTTRFDLTPHLHPLVDAENISFRLAYKGGGLDLNKLRLQADSTSYEIEVMATNGTCLKVDNSIATFRLVPRYQVCVPDALLVAKRSRLGGRYRMLTKILTKLNFSEKHPLGFDETNDSYKNVIAGKLKLDIARQFKVI